MSIFGGVFWFLPDGVEECVTGARPGGQEGPPPPAVVLVAQLQWAGTRGQGTGGGGEGRGDGGKGQGAKGRGRGRGGMRAAMDGDECVRGSEGVVCGLRADP